MNEKQERLLHETKKRGKKATELLTASNEIHQAVKQGLISEDNARDIAIELNKKAIAEMDKTIELRKEFIAEQDNRKDSFKQ